MKTRLSSDSWILTRPCAHRGLHGDGIAENSAAAFSRAVSENYPIELDVQMTADDKLVVFHDDNMKRMTGLDADVRELTLSRIKELSLTDGQKVPTFEEFLSLVGGKVPLLIEIKQQKRKGVEALVLKALEGYKGEFVLQSFDPIVVLNIKKLAPHIIRGQLGTGEPSGLKGIKRRIVNNLSLNFLTRPDFINFDIRSFPIRKSVHNGLPVIGWTVRNDQDRQVAEKYCLSYVFENIRP